jgi:hypothetical protein
MSEFKQNPKQDEIVAKYFSDSDKKINLKTGDVLLHQYEENKRIFYVRDGKVSGFIPDKHISEPIFEAVRNSFVGVYSYFAYDHKSYTEVRAAEPTTIYYFDQDHRSMELQEADDFLDFLFDIVVLELRSRQRFAAQMAREKQNAMNNLIKTEKLATLGQLSAGLAHELNNSIGSLSANLRQLEADIRNHLVSMKDNRYQPYFQLGIEKGQQLSNSEAREARNKWPKSLNLSTATIKKLCKANIPPGEIHSATDADEIATLWAIGNILHDMRIASVQASHVISSIKSMGLANQNWSENVDIKQTIFEAMSILRSMTREVHMEVNLPETFSGVEACHGELVQVWINLIKNAIEVLIQHKVENPTLIIDGTENEKHIEIAVEDNGTGIDPAIVEKIYEPSFTTKVEGISLGLGLGLSIVQRILNEHQADLKLESRPGKTRFTVILNKQLSK